MRNAKYEKIGNYYIIPNLITFTNMFLGALAIFYSFNGNILDVRLASIFILIAAITDKLDGYMARRLGQESEFGKQLDSLCDLVSFGVAPAIIWWNLMATSLSILEILISIGFIASGVFRLARFNVETNKGYIVGMPITIAGMIMALKYIIDIEYRLVGTSISSINIENLILMLLLSILMISKIRIKK